MLIVEQWAEISMPADDDDDATHVIRKEHQWSILMPINYSRSTALGRYHTFPMSQQALKEFFHNMWHAADKEIIAMSVVFRWNIILILQHA